MNKNKQTENAEFRDLFEELNWPAAEVARAIGLSRSGVSVIINGKRTPRKTTLILLRRLVDDIKKRRSQSDHLAVSTLAEELSFIELHFPAGYDCATMMITLLHATAQQRASRAGNTMMIEQDLEAILSEASKKPRKMVPKPSMGEVEDSPKKSS